MLLNELNLKALCVSAESVLPLSVAICVEGKELNFTINEFKSSFGSGKKSVISGSIKRVDNGTEKILENSDIEKVRRVCASLCELSKSGRTSERKPRMIKEQKEVEQLRQNLAVARRLPKEWLTIDADKLRAAFKAARQMDRAPQKLAKITELDTEKQLKAYELLKNAGLL